MAEILYELDIPKDTPKELTDLVNRCFKEKPARDDLAALQEYLQETPELYKAVFDLADFLQNQAIEKFIDPNPESPKAKKPGWVKGAELAIKANLAALKESMGYQDAPVIERLLIENIAASWLHCQWVEFQLSTQASKDVGMSVVEWWEKRTSATQRRYLRAIETLARVRKLARNTPALQVNIAAEGGQQLNVGGNIVKGESK